VTFAQRTEMQRRWVPDIASRFRDDEQNLSFLSAINVQAMGGSATIGA
jgi:hypothetical protein